MARFSGLHVLYWIVLIGTFLGVATWESFRARRPLTCPEGRRWGCHLVLMFSQSIVLYGLLRWSGPVLVAVAFADSRFGLLNKTFVPYAVRCILAVMVLDFVKFTTHWASHAVPALWRLHQVHHSDPDFDVTTAGRFHPFESIFFAGAQMAAIALLAPPFAGVIGWQLISSFQGLFAHANANLAAPLERLLRIVVYTPDLHRIHHSEEIAEQGTNFGDLLPIWDRLFGTYLATPAAGRDGIVTGLKEFPKERGTDLVYLLTLPFRRPLVNVAAPEPASSVESR